MKVSGLRWYMISLIALSTVINFIDRSAINVMWPYIYQDFGITTAESKTALAIITTFFLVAYAVGQTVFGKIMDWVGIRMGMVYAILVWSLSIALHALSRSLFSFNIYRLFLGLGEAGNWPGATKSNAEWFPPKERAIAQGIFGGSTALGSMIAAPVVSLLFLEFGWRGTFFCIGLLGLVWIIPWLVVNKGSPAEHPWITKNEQTYILTGEISADQHISIPKGNVYSWKQLLTFKNTWGIILSRFFIDPVWWLFITWLPTFMKEQFLFDMKQIASFSWFPFLLAALGGVSGGSFSAYIIKRNHSAVKARRKSITVGCLIMLASLISIFCKLDQLTARPGQIMLLIGIALFGFQFLISNLQTLPSDYFHGKNVGTISGMAGSAAVLGTLITTWLVPYLTHTGYKTFFLMGSMLVPMAWLSLYVFRSDIKHEH